MLVSQSASFLLSRAHPLIPASGIIAQARSRRVIRVMTGMLAAAQG